MGFSFQYCEQVVGSSDETEVLLADDWGGFDGFAVFFQPTVGNPYSPVQRQSSDDRALRVSLGEMNGVVMAGLGSARQVPVRWWEETGVLEKQVNWEMAIQQDGASVRLHEPQQCAVTLLLSVQENPVRVGHGCAGQVECGLPLLRRREKAGVRSQVAYFPLARPGR